MGQNISGCLLGMCGKPKFGSDSVFKKPNRQKNGCQIFFFLDGSSKKRKFDIRLDGFSTETACKFAIYVKSDKKLLYLHSNVHIKNGLNTTETEISTEIECSYMTWRMK